MINSDLIEMLKTFPLDADISILIDDGSFTGHGEDFDAENLDGEGVIVFLTAKKFQGD